MALIKSLFILLNDLFYFFIKGSVAYARKKGVNVGKNCRIYIKNWGSEPFLISLGSNVTITSGVKFITHDGSTCLVRNNKGQRYQRFGPINIGSNVFVGVNSIIMPGVNIGSNVVIGAGSVVTKDIPDNSVVVGVPAKVISNFSDFKNKVETTCVNDSELIGINDYEARVYHAIDLQKDR